MLKIFLISSMLFSLNAFSQQPTKPDPTSSINAQEQINGLPGGKNSGRAYSVRAKKKVITTVPAGIAPIQNTHTPANCADSMAGSGSNTFTACEAAKGTR